MIIAARYSFNRGLEVLHDRHHAELQEVYDAIAQVDAAACLTKASREKTDDRQTPLLASATEQGPPRQLPLSAWLDEAQSVVPYRYGRR